MRGKWFAAKRAAWASLVDSADLPNTVVRSAAAGFTHPAGVEALAREPIKAGARIGHIHLEVDDLAKAKKFYGDVVGFKQVASLPGAAFLSAGGYHHHIGMNVWESRNGPPPSPHKAGLSKMTFELPDQASIEALRQRLESAGVAAIPAENGLDFFDLWRTSVAVRRQ